MNAPLLDLKQHLNTIQKIAVGAVILSGMFMMSRYNFLLFHGLAELFSIAVAWSVFLLAWNTRRISSNDALLFLGIAFLFIGLIDFLHILSYKGMGVFPDHLGANYPTQLWIAARGLEAISLLLFPLLITRQIRIGLVIGTYAAITAFIIAAIFSWHVFPDCYIEGQGLTTFKKGAEYVISLTFIAAITLLFRIRNQLDKTVFLLMIAAMAVAIAGELAFTFYVSVYALSNVAGHFLKIISFFLIYLALVRSSLTRPYTTIFHKLEKEKAALKESEAKLQQAQSIAGMGDFTWDIASGAVILSDGMYRLLKYDKRDIFDYNTLNNTLHHPDDQERITKYLKDSIDSGEEILPTNEYRMVRKDGNVIYVQINGRIEYRDKKAATLIGTCIDITKRKLTDAKILERNSYITTILETTSDGFWVLDGQGCLIEVNEAYCLMSGYGKNELLQLSVPDLEANEQPDETAARMQLITQTGSECFETRHRRKDGSIFDVEVSTTWQDSNQRFICFCRDITIRKQADEALRESEDRYRELFENAPFPYQSLDGEGCFIEANRRWLDHLGYSREEVVGKSFADFLHPDWQDHFRENFTQFKSIGEVLGVEFQLRKKDGTYIWASFDGKINRSHAGNFIQTHCIFTDISEQKRLEDKLNQQREALNQSQKLQSVGRLAGGIAHDFNNMLSIILGYTDLALEKLEPNDPLYGDMEEIYQAGTRSADLTRQLLAFARQQTVSPKVLDLNDNIGRMIKMLRQLIGEDIDLAWMPGTDLWSVKIDTSQFDQILANLCVNARDAIIDVGKVTIETKNIAFDEDYCAVHAEFLPGEYVMLAVSDDGCGIAPEALNHIFEPFFTTKKIGQGTGLGLSTVYGIVKQNNGFINVYSELDKGTTFKVYLSRNVAQAIEVRKKTALETPLSHGETILLVEDDASILKLGVRILKNLGYKVLSTTKSKDAQKMAEEYDGQINLLITDVVMPEMNGRELSEQLQILYPQLKILFMSGYTANVIAHRGVLDEGIHFISKPFSPKEIALKIREILD